MTPQVKDVLTLLEQVAPERFAETWDNPGLQTGFFDQEVTKIFFALDPSLQAVRLASKCKAELLLTHHPLIFRPLLKLDTGIYPGDVIREAIAKKISVIAAHTNLDAAEGGMNDILAVLFGLQDVEVLEEIEGVGTVGLGRIGHLPQPVPLGDFGREVRRLIGAEKLIGVGREDTLIQRVAVVGGSGGSFVSQASRREADLLLTGDVSHHHALEAESRGIALLDGGHFNLERTAFMIFSERFQTVAKTQGWDFAVELYQNETNPLQIF